MYADSNQTRPCGIPLSLVLQELSSAYEALAFPRRLPEPRSLRGDGSASTARDAVSIAQLAAIDEYRRGVKPTPRPAGLAADYDHTDKAVKIEGPSDSPSSSGATRLPRITPPADSTSSSSQRAQDLGNKESTDGSQPNPNASPHADEPTTDTLLGLEPPPRRYVQRKQRGSGQPFGSRELTAALRRLTQPERRGSRPVPLSIKRGRTADDAGTDVEADADSNPRSKKRVRLPPRAPASVPRKRSKQGH